ncbi:MAG: peptide chain release factor-like protein [Verrucomicrobiota bacterium]
MTAFPTDASSEEHLTARMAALGLRESDLEESFVRSGGHGGQNVNKTSTCVVLLHRPTGLQVKCQTTRNQGRNRLIARQLLLEKIAAQRQAKVSAKRAQVEKARRQQLKRTRRAKERMLADKAHRSDKKSARQGGRGGWM